MNHWDWFAVVAFGGIVGTLWTIKSLLEKLNEQIGNVRYILNEMNERQQLIRDSVHAISVDAGRMPKQPRYDNLGGQL